MTEQYPEKGEERRSREKEGQKKVDARKEKGRKRVEEKGGKKEKEIRSLI